MTIYFSLTFFLKDHKLPEMPYKMKLEGEKVLIIKMQLNVQLYEQRQVSKLGQISRPKRRSRKKGGQLELNRSVQV